VVIQV
jgi:hypothetical protein